MTDKFILGIKDRMTQIFDKDGDAVPVTVINVFENVVTQVKTSESKDGYNSIQLATVPQKESRLPKSLLGHLKSAYKFIKEFRVDNSDLKVGDKINFDIFEEGEKIIVSATSKGKGFQGGVKRWGFSGGRRSHGNKHAEREVGSIGAGTTPGRVWKGKKMPGRMGSDRITIKGLTIAKIDSENGRILIKGAIPGKPGTLVEIVKKNI